MSEVRWVELEQEERKARIARVVKKKGRFHEDSWVVRLESTIRVVPLGPQKPTACFHFSANYLQKGSFLPEYSPFESWGLY